METWHRREALLAWLRTRPTATSSEAADRFGVSTRTILRDIAALRENGEPIESDAGRGGGLRVDILRSLPPVRMQLEQIVGLFLWFELARLSDVLPCAASAAPAVNQLMSVLPPNRAREVRRTVKRVVVTGRPASHHGPQAFEELLPIVERAINGGRGLHITFRDPTAPTGRSAIDVEVHGLLIHTAGWALITRVAESQRALLVDLGVIEGARHADHVRFAAGNLTHLLHEASAQHKGPAEASSRAG